MKKAKIDGQIYDVITLDEYMRSPNAFDKFTAIDGGDGLIYPIRNTSDNRPGFYDYHGITRFLRPSPADQYIYSAQNVFNFDDAVTMREIIALQREVKNAERSILTTIDNEFIPEVTPHDTPEMRAVKEAIIDKHIDIDKYESRFGPNYNNDRRLLKKSSITFGKLRTVMDALDMKGTLIIEDKSSDVPNPIGRKVIVALNGESASDIDEEE